MKKGFFFLWVVLMVILLNLACAETPAFTIRGGIKFGMDHAEVKSFEQEHNGLFPTKEQDSSGLDNVEYEKITALGVSDKVKLSYYFHDGKLWRITYFVEDSNGKVYDDWGNLLVEKYGLPVCTKKTNEIVTFPGSTIYDNIEKYSMIITVFDYAQWVIDCGEYVVLIEAEIANNTLSTNTSIEYKFYTHDEIAEYELLKQNQQNQMMSDI